MKTTIKWILRILMALVSILLLVALFIYFRGVPTYKYEPTEEIKNLKVVSDSIKIERGAKIASLLCSECHRNFNTGELTGHVMLDMPKEFGTIATLNITQDKEAGIGNWTDGELYYYLRTSVRKDGRYNPIMGGYSLMADEDIYSIIAWLRSDFKPLHPSKDEYPENQYNLLVKFLCNTAFKPKALPKNKIIIPDSSNRIAFGKYIANDLCGCFQCHSADFKTMNTDEPEKSEGFYGGGNPMLNYESLIVPSANITMDKETGIGNWTEDQFIQAVRFNKKPDGTLLNLPMFPHSSLTDNEVKAIWEYLQTIPTIKNKVNRFVDKS